MRAKKNFYVVAYDVVDDNKRNRVAKILEKNGNRANKSVFECMITDSQYHKLYDQIVKNIDAETDKVIFYKLCVNCYTKTEYVPEKPDVLDTVVMV